MTQAGKLVRLASAKRDYRHGLAEFSAETLPVELTRAADGVLLRGRAGSFDGPYRNRSNHAP
jgi:hypothetical protein